MGYHVKKRNVDRMLTQHKKQCQFDISSIDEEKKRVDPLYALLYFPNIVLKVPNTINEHHQYIDRMLYTALYYCENKIGGAFYNDVLVARVFKQICSPGIKNNGLKVFALFALMWLEPVVIDLMRSLYKCKKRLERFNEILPHVLKHVAGVLYSGFNIYNVTAIKEQFIFEHVIPLYQTGGIY
jgi:hypothetical protein